MVVVVVYRGREWRGEADGGWRMRFCHVPAHTQQLTGRERNASSGHMTTHTHTHTHIECSEQYCLAEINHKFTDKVPD